MKTFQADVDENGKLSFTFLSVRSKPVAGSKEVHAGWKQRQKHFFYWLFGQIVIGLFTL